MGGGLEGRNGENSPARSCAKRHHHTHTQTHTHANPQSPHFPYPSRFPIFVPLGHSNRHPMTWFLYAILTAFFDSLKVVFGKHSLNKLDIYLAGWAWRFFAIVILGPVLLFLPLPDFQPGFWWAVLISGSINLIVTPMYMRAIQTSDLSLVMPLITFTPLFLLITSPLILGEFPSLMGLGGMVLIVLGAYTLNLNRIKEGFWQPILALGKEKGPRLMLLVAFLWSISSNVDKIGMEASSPVHYAGGLIAFLVIGLTPVVLWRSPTPVTKTKKHFLPLALLGICSGLVLVFQMLAMELTLVAYVISIKRASVGLSVIWGYLIFGEKHLKNRLPAVLLMLAGVVLITLGNGIGM